MRALCGRLGLLAAALAGCGGGGITGTPVPPPDSSDSQDTAPPSSLRVDDLDWEVLPDIRGPFVVRWMQSEPGIVRLEYELDGRWWPTPDIDGVEGQNRAVVLGVPLGRAVPYRLVGTAAGRVDGATDLLDDRIPVDLPPVTLVTSDTARWEASGGHVFLPLSVDAFRGWATIVDRQGRPVWTALTGNVRDAHVSVSGDAILWGDATRQTLQRAHLDSLAPPLDAPGFTTAFVEQQDGTLVWEATGELRALSPGTVTPTTLIADAASGQVNSLAWDVVAQTLLLADEGDSSVVSVDATSGAERWRASELAGGLTFDPPGSRFVDPHGIDWLEDGGLLVSTQRRFPPALGLLEYAVDADAGVLELMWRYDSDIASDSGQAWVERLPSGNTLHAIEQAGVVYEVTDDKSVAWRVDVTDAAGIGRAQVLDDLYALTAQ